MRATMEATAHDRDYFGEAQGNVRLPAIIVAPGDNHAVGFQSEIVEIAPRRAG